MRKLDGLREVLAGDRRLPWKLCAGEIFGADDGVIVAAEFADDTDPDLRAIVLSVNLAPLLVRVAEAADLVFDGLDAEIDGQTITLEEAVRRHDALGDALTSLRLAAGTGGKGGGE